MSRFTKQSFENILLDLSVEAVTRQEPGEGDCDRCDRYESWTEGRELTEGVTFCDGDEDWTVCPACIVEDDDLLALVSFALQGDEDPEEHCVWTSEAGRAAFNGCGCSIHYSA